MPSWWTALATGVVAALLTKLLDVTWLEARLRERERKQWLRDRRLNAFSALARLLRRYGFEDGEPDEFVIRQAAAEVVLLIDDDSLCRRVDALVELVLKLQRVAVARQMESLDENISAADSETDAILREFRLVLLSR